jgi:vanadium chloroperoxidase
MQDSILFWNAVALEANRISHSDPDKRQQNGPTLSSRAIAIVHLAMYDAFAAVDGLPHYLPAPPPPAPGTSARDAVAGAAHWTLSNLYSTQADFFDAQLSGFNTADPSFEFGREVGRALLHLRRHDMDARDSGYVPSPKRGRHRRDPDNPGQGFYAPFYGAQNKTFAVSQRHTLAPPPFDDGTHMKYHRALVDVRARGIKPELTATLPTTTPFTNRRRSPEDTLLGIYWGYDGANRLGTPPRLYNQIVRLVAMNVINTNGRINNESDNARLFAFVNAALGDAGILAWEQKYCHDFWRPVVGIREHHGTFGPAAPHDADTEFVDGDPGWLPLGAPSTNSAGMKNFTPDFPAYPSGHATFGAAALHITRMFYGITANNKSRDNLFQDLFFVSDEFNGGNRDNNGTVRPRHTRYFPDGLWQMIIENAVSRVMLGVHWIFDAFDFTGGGGNSTPNPSLADEHIGGVGLGLRIARDIFAHGSGQGPQMTPDTVLPPITTPSPGSPMPTHPEQPTEVGGCIGPAIAERTRRVTKPTKKGAKKGARKKAAKGDVITEESGKEEQAWPSGISEQDEAAPTGSGAWPSGISEK